MKKSSLKQLMLFHGYFQNGQQADITASQDGRGYQPLKPVIFSTKKFTKEY